MTMQNILQILEETRASFVLLLCHQNADPDAIGSAFAFQGLMKRLFPNVVVEIGAGEGISKLSKHLLEHLPITVSMKPSVENSEVIVLLDTNTVQQLGKLSDTVAKSTAPIIVVDHHAPHPETLEKVKLSITNDKASSTCEVVYNLFKQVNVKPDVHEAQALFLGIAYDTKHFVLANSSTLRTISELCDLGVDPQETIVLLSLPMDSSERTARIKACRRARLVNINDWLIAFSHVSAYQASAARALIDLGAHAAAVAGKRNDSVEISFRCTREFIKVTGIHLGKDVAKPLGEVLEGMGGGHDAAAGANGIGTVDKVLKLCRQIFKEKLSKTE